MQHIAFVYTKFLLLSLFLEFDTIMEWYKDIVEPKLVPVSRVSDIYGHRFNACIGAVYLCVCLIDFDNHMT